MLVCIISREILLTLVCTDTSTSASVSMMFEKAGVPKENLHFQAVERHTLSHTTTVHHGDQTWAHL